MFVSNCFRPTVSRRAASRKRLQPGVSVSPWRNDLDGWMYFQRYHSPLAQEKPSKIEDILERLNKYLRKALLYADYFTRHRAYFFF